MEIADAIKKGSEYGEQVCKFAHFRKLNFTWMNNLAIMLIGPNESI